MITLRRARLAAGLLAAMSFAAPAVAQEPSPEQIKAAREVIDASGAADSIKDIVPIFLDEAKQTLTRTRPEIATQVDEALKTLQPDFLQRKEELMNSIASVYAQRFTAQELTEIKAFYQSPTGVKLVKALPDVLRQSYEETNLWSQKMSTDIISRLRAELKKKGVDI